MTIELTTRPRKQEAPKVPPLVQKRQQNQAFRLRLSIEAGLYSSFLLLGHLTTAYDKIINPYAFVVFLFYLIVISNNQIVVAITQTLQRPSLGRFLRHLAIPTWAPIGVYVLGCIVG